MWCEELVQVVHSVLLSYPHTGCNRLSVDIYNENGLAGGQSAACESLTSHFSHEIKVGD